MESATPKLEAGHMSGLPPILQSLTPILASPTPKLEVDTGKSHNLPFPKIFVGIF